MKLFSPRSILRCLAAALVATMAVVVGGASPAAACSCIGFQDAVEAGQDFGAVFVGSVIDQREAGSSQFGEQELELVFAVDALYQGELTNRALVYSHEDNGANCGYSGGGEVAVLAYVDSSQRLRTDGCSVMNVDAGGSTVDILEARFGTGVTPPESTVDLPDSPLDDAGGVPWEVVGLAGFVVVLGGLLTVVLRSSKSDA